MTLFHKTAYRIQPIQYSIAMELVIKHHYLHRKAPCSVAFGLMDKKDSIVGVICYGTPSSAPLRKGIAGDANTYNVVELTRLWVADSVPKNGESFLIANTLGKCGKEIVVSYADTAQGHIGVVYQATNWIYTGLSAKRTNWTVTGSEHIHCQTLADKYTAKEIRAKFGDAFKIVERSRKHRYVFLNAAAKRKKQLLKQLKYPILPYPKLCDYRKN